jgi:hypothetical protein
VRVLKKGAGVRGQKTARLGLLMVAPVLAQQAPLSPPPKILLIGREFIKPGKKAEVFKIERGSVEAQARLKSPHSYWVISSMSGPDDLWWLNGAESYGDFEEELAKVAAIPGLLDEWARTPALKADLVADPRQFYARLREDLSYGAGAGEKARYFLVTTVTVLPGHRAEFIELRKLIKHSHERGPGTTNAAVYEAESGTADGTFVIFSGTANLEDAGALSRSHARDSDAPSSSAIATSETALFTVTPEISYRAGQR